MNFPDNLPTEDKMAGPRTSLGARFYYNQWVISIDTHKNCRAALITTSMRTSGRFRGGGGGQNPPQLWNSKKYCRLPLFFAQKKCNMLMHANSTPPFTKSLDLPLRTFDPRAMALYNYKHTCTCT